ncbi:MAG: HD domain-containing protein [Anaerolineales bacterium]|nr:HD domain-containing protein [Anaerolineales bacterium]
MNWLAIPSPEQAESYLQEAALRNPGPWEAHSRYVAQGASIIAARHPLLEPERAYVLGLLHDIGRRFGVTGMRHAIDGYDFLREQGFEDAGRICLTHSYPVKGLVEAASPWDGSPQELRFLRRYLAAIEYDDYDRLIQLLDSLSLPTGFCLMEKRLIDVTLRYGVNEHTASRWRGFFQIKQHIEGAIGVSIYRLLPGVVENTFEWGEDGYTTQA